MKKSIFLFAMIILMVESADAFCGFYVAKASSALFNNKSQVILVRDGNLNTITMSNDFQGDVDEFAMVVPVPVVLEKEDIKIVTRSLFDRLDAYSAPRMVEYYDNNPCQLSHARESKLISVSMSTMITEDFESEVDDANYGVTIEAKYSVEEYDIMILSATKSSGLQDWLDKNGYQVPKKAEEVLKPYIKNNMKFFVVKVNREKLQSANSQYLRPIQISYHHNKFMLPIRLGMANSSGEQDMIVYAMSKKGRLECANYRTVKMPTDRNIPKFILDRAQFGDFYRDAFKNAYTREGKNAVFLEYAWDVSPQSGVKCDPCVAPAPYWNDFQEAGVNWINNSLQSAPVYFTRLHVRYSRDEFPQDLLFLETPNRENFQARYVIHHPAYGDLSCDAGQEYLQTLKSRRKLEVDELKALTGWSKKSYKYYVNQYAEEEEDDENFIPIIYKNGPSKTTLMMMYLSFIVLSLLVGMWFTRYGQPKLIKD